MALRQLNPTLDASCGSRPQNPLMFDMELPLRGNFFPLGFPVSLLTNDPDVLLACSESFGHIHAPRRSAALEVRVGVFDSGESQCPPPPMRREFNHLYSLVANANNQALLDLKSLTNFAWLSKAAVANRLYLKTNFLEKMIYLLLGARYVTDLHAACVSKNGRGILLCGDSGAGKSSLAYACARSGWTYTSDDTSYLINESSLPRVIGHCHRVRFRPSARSLFPELQEHALTPRMEGKPSIEIPISQLPVRFTSAEANVEAIVYLHRNSSGFARLIRQPAGTGTLHLRQELFSAGEIRAKHEKLLGVLWNIPTYDLQYSDLDSGITELESLTS